MAQWTADGLPRATNLFEAAAWHQAIKPVCRCGHSASFNPHGLWWHFERHRWDDRLSDIPRRFWCLCCRLGTRRKVAPVRVELVRESEADITLPWPPEHVWKRHVQRFR